MIGEFVVKIIELVVELYFEVVCDIYLILEIYVLGFLFF